VDGHPHQVGADELAPLQSGSRRRRVEALQPAPQRHVVRQRRLRLQPHQVTDGGLDGQIRPAQQQLPVQRGPVQAATVQTIRPHPLPPSLTGEPFGRSTRTPEAMINKASKIR
jgi:hypothetical protein